MKRCLPVWLLVIGVLLSAFNARAETETIDLKALAKKARPAVMLLVVSDSSGKEIATGTGFLVSSDGKLITNHHVIEGAASTVAKAENGGLFPVEGVLADDPKNDLVLLKLKGKDLPFLPLGNSDKIEVGTRIAVIGSPLGLEGSVSEGIVSAVRNLPGKSLLLQITAAISHGSSGSPVLNGNGEVLGVAASQIVEGQSINFAIPIELAKQCLNQISPSGATTRALTSSKKRRVPSTEEVEHTFRWAQAKRNGDLAEELKEVKYLAALVPNDPEILRRLGETYSSLTLHADAVAAVQNAIRIQPDNPELWLDLGNEYTRLEKWSEAALAYQESIRIWPDYAVSWGLLAITYELLGKNDDAKKAKVQAGKFKTNSIDTFELSVKNNPGNTLAWRCLLQAYKQSNDVERLRSFTREMIQTYPDDENVWNESSVLWGMHSKQDYTITNAPGNKTFVVVSDHIPRKYEIEDIANKLPVHPSKEPLTIEISSETWGDLCKQFIGEHSDNELAWRTLFAAAVLERKDVSDFCAVFVESHPNNSYAWRTLGMCCNFQRNKERAITALERAAKLNPADAITYTALAQIYADAGQESKSQEALKRLAEIDPTAASLYKQNRAYQIQK